MVDAPGTIYYDLAEQAVRCCSARQMGKIPWRGIADFLESVESPRTIEGFARQVLQALERVLAFDRAFFMEAGPGNPGGVKLYSRGESSESRIREYTEHYQCLDPVVRILPRFSMAFVDWARYDEDEFSRDFIAKAGSSFAFALSDLCQKGKAGFILIVSRSGSRDFTEREKLTAAALLPHLHNINSVILAPEQFRVENLAKTLKSVGLTQREGEVAHLLCNRLSVGEIADLLFVSRKTAAKHLEHIYLKLGVEGKQQARERLLTGVT